MKHNVQFRYDINHIAERASGVRAPEADENQAAGRGSVAVVEAAGL
jgi:hypothetical protein